MLVVMLIWQPLIMLLNSIEIGFCRAFKMTPEGLEQISKGKL